MLCFWGGHWTKQKAAWCRPGRGIRGSVPRSHSWRTTQKRRRLKWADTLFRLSLLFLTLGLPPLPAHWQKPAPPTFPLMCIFISKGVTTAQRSILCRLCRRAKEIQRYILKIKAAYVMLLFLKIILDICLLYSVSAPPPFFFLSFFIFNVLLCSWASKKHLFFSSS